jgi:hypothetical protein
MPTDPALFTRAERERLLERLDELCDLADLMRQPGGLPSVREPVPLHRAGRDTPEGRPGRERHQLCHRALRPGRRDIHA